MVISNYIALNFFGLVILNIRNSCSIKIALPKLHVLDFMIAFDLFIVISAQIYCILIFI